MCIQENCGYLLQGAHEDDPFEPTISMRTSQTLADHFLSRFADRYLLEIRDSVQNMAADRAPRVTAKMDYLPSKLGSPPNSHISNKGPAKWKSKLSTAGWKSARPVTEYIGKGGSIPSANAAAGPQPYPQQEL